MATSVATPLERRLGIDRRRQRDDLVEQQVGSDAHQPAVRPRSRNIDGAAREVQAAINASRVDLPATLRSNPTYRKANPSAAPVIILALTSQTLTPGQIYDAVSNIVSQRLAQVDGVGDVEIGGGTLPAVRVELLPFALNRYGISGEDVRAAIQASNANRPKGAIEGDGRRLQIYTPDAGARAPPTTRRWSSPGATARRCGSPTSPRSVDGVENTRTLGLFNGKPAVIVLVTPPAGRQRHRDRRRRARAAARAARAAAGSDIELEVASDRTNSIRASLREIELTLMISIVAGGAGGQRVPAQRCARPSSRRWRRSSRCSAPSA